MIGPLLEFWRAVVLGIGAFTLGLGMYLMWAYLRQHIWPKRPYDVRAHVLAIITSYLILLGTLEAQILHRAFDRDPLTYRLPLASVAFPLGAYALTKLMRGRARDPKPKEGDHEG